jgi:hypothetical protein
MDNAAQLVSSLIFLSGLSICVVAIFSLGLFF